MNIKKIILTTLCLVVCFAFAACGDKEQNFGGLHEEAKTAYEDDLGELQSGTIKDTLSNTFFDWTLNSVETKETLEGKTPEEGKIFVVANITVKNTSTEEYEVGNYDFIGIVGIEEGEQFDTLDAFYDGMYPDGENLAAGKTLTGDIVFEVSADCTELIIDYQEYFGDDSKGNTNWFYIKL
ncbi:hypothetical protein M2140_002146 [Clostridiales Family XIII bacterium PM5-7]